ncbi:MAG: GNAT family N-acetyltransferase [Chloroflexota bacterium]
MSIYTRPVTLNDAQAIINIFNPIIETGLYTVFDTPFTVEEERAYIENLSPRSTFFVAVDQDHDQIVGFQSMDPFATYTHAFDHVGVVGTYVDLAQRRKGIAKHLFETTFEAAKALDYQKIFTFIRGDNPAALNTYMRHGFRIVGTAQKHAKINGQYIDEIIVEKFL